MQNAKRLLNAAAGVVASWVPIAATELLFLVGGSMVTRGAWLIAEPVGWTVGGLLMVLTGVVVSRARR
jgi:hypothetical protein